MSLGSAFPAELRLQHARRALVPGAVVKLWRRMDDGRFHEKRYVVLHVDEQTLTCVVNSEPTSFAKKTPAVWRCQVSLPRAGNEFMSHDSFVDCSRVRSLTTHDVLVELCGHPEHVLGVISATVRLDVMAGLKAAETIAPAIVGKICEALALG